QQPKRVSNVLDERLHHTVSPHIQLVGRWRSRKRLTQCYGVGEMTRAAWAAAFASLALFGGLAPGDTDSPVHRGTGDIRYSTLTHIDKTNISTLQVAWRYDAGDAFTGSEMQSNPIVVNGVLYATTPTLKVIALDAASGRAIWKFDPSGGAAPGARFRHRGVAVHRDRVFVT